MSTGETDIEFRSDESAEERNKPRWSHAMTAAVIGGAAATAAGAVLGARALARRNGAEDGKPLNAFMATACTASEVSRNRGAADPDIQPSAHPRPR